MVSAPARTNSLDTHTRYVEALLYMKPIGVRDIRTEPNKTAKLNIRLTEEDLVLVINAAEAQHVPPAEFARRALRGTAEAVLAAAEKPRPTRKKKS